MPPKTLSPARAARQRANNATSPTTAGSGAARRTASSNSNSNLRRAASAEGTGRGAGGAQQQLASGGSNVGSSTTAGGGGSGAGVSRSRAAAAKAAAEQAAAAAALAAERAKPLRTFVGCGPITCLAVNHIKGDLLCVGTAHGDIAVIASDVADPVLAEEAGGNAEPVSGTNILRNAHRKKVTSMAVDAQGRFVTGSGDGSIKLWAVDPAVSLFPVCVKTLFPAEYAAELEKPVVPPREKKFEVPEVCCVVTATTTTASAAAGEFGDQPSVIIYAGYSDGVLRKWSPDAERCVQKIQPGIGRLTCLAHNGQYLCCGDDSGLVSIFAGGDTATGEAMQTQWPEPVRCVAVVGIAVPPTSLKNPNPAPSIICFAGTASGTVYGIDVNTGAKKCALKHFGCDGTGVGDSSVVQLISGPNCLLSAHDNGCVLLWNVLDWTVAGQFLHMPVEGRSSVLAGAAVFRLPDDPPIAGAAGGDDGGAASPAAAYQPPSSLARPVSSGRPQSVATAATTTASVADGPPVKVAMVTASMAGSLHVHVHSVTDAVQKLHHEEQEKAREVIAALKAKRAEEKANKRRF